SSCRRASGSATRTCRKTPSWPPSSHPARSMLRTVRFATIRRSTPSDAGRAFSNAIDTPIEFVGAALFVTAWVVGLGSVLYAYWESLRIARLDASVFGRGCVVMATTRQIGPLDPARVDRDIVRTTTGQFRFVSPTECLFAARPWHVRFNTPFPLKG